MGQLEDLKEYNAFRVFEELSLRKSASRPELASATGLSRATVGLLVDYLAERELVRETGVGSSTGGRPPVLLEYNPDAVFALGAGMHDQSWTVVLANLASEVIDRETVPMSGTDPASAVEAIRIGVNLITSRHPTRRLLPKIGIGSPGLVDWDSGIVKSAVDVGWYEVPLAKMVENSIGLPCYVLNRSKLGALAEYWDGGKSIKDLVYISLGTGIAAGIIHNGELYIGSTSSAGELGHTTAVPDGPLCACGNRGCLQQLVSEQALATIARERLRYSHPGELSKIAGRHPERLSVFDLFDAAEEADSAALDILNEAAGHLGIAIANIVNLLNPQRIVLGGPMASAGSLFCTMIEDSVRKHAMIFSLSDLIIEQSKLGLDAGAIGAAVLVLQDAANLIFNSSLNIH